MSWDDALRIWGLVLDEIVTCAEGIAACAVLDQQDCQAACTVLAQIAREWKK